MRALMLKAFGGAENFELAEIAKPDAQAGTVLIRVHAASVNPVDIKIRNGLPIAPELPAVLGADAAGIIEQVGSGVSGLKAGDEVYGCVGGIKNHGGTLAEYVVADARLVAPKPRALSMREAAAVPLVGITAWEALDRANVSQNDHVLVHAGVGGVGHIAVQLAKAKGARVAATVSSDEAAAVARSLGADETINYREEKVDAYVARLTQGKGFDIVIDTVGGDNLQNCFMAAAYEARVATINARTTQDLSPMHAKGLSLHAIFMLLPLLRNVGRDRHGEILRRLAELVDSGKLRPLIDPHRFTLESAADAQRHLESGRARGKVVIDIVPHSDHRSS